MDAGEKLNLNDLSSEDCCFCPETELCLRPMLDPGTESKLTNTVLC